jgi:hypothetical protein
MTSARFFDVAGRIDAAIAAARPEAAIAEIRGAPENLSIRRYLFEKLPDSSSLPALRDAGVFNAPPVSDGWPESRFLVRLAPLDPGAVLDIILAMPGTPNPLIHRDFLDAAIAMPSDLAARVASRELGWVASQEDLIGPICEALGTLISNLANGGQVAEALRLARVVLAVLPDNARSPLSPAPRGRMRDWSYQKVLETNLPHLVTAEPRASLTLLCELLNSAVRLSRGEADREPPEDFSIHWRHAIEDSFQDLSPTIIQGVRGLLVTALRDTAERAVEGRLIPIGDVLRLLENDYGWLVFQRIALHLLRRFPSGVTALIRERLLNRNRVADSYDLSVLHEYALLLREHFRDLVGDEQATLLGWIDDGPDSELVRHCYQEIGRPLSNERVDAYGKHWRLNRLALIRDDLPVDWRARYDHLARELGEPEHPEFQFYSSGVQSGPTSPITSQDLRSLSAEDVIAFLVQFHTGWAPNEDFTKPSPAGLSSELSAAVASDPERFATHALRFRDLDPTYVRGLLYGLDQAGRQNRRFNWLPVLELCRWVVEQPGGGSGTAEEDAISILFGLDRSWEQSRLAVAHLLCTGLSSKEAPLPLDLRDAVWVVLQPLTRDPQPDQDHEDRYLKGAGPASVSLNTVRGEAMHGVVRYALWVRKHMEKTAAGNAEIRRGLDVLPEVRRVFEAHLDPATDPAISIRSVYGQWFPWLHLLDPGWALSNRSRIFPPEDVYRRYWAAAWSAYVIFCPVYDNVFEVLQDEYARAIELTGSEEANVERIDRADQHLAEHLALLYGRGKTSIETPSLLSKFFDKADDKLRAHLLQTAGRILGQDERPIAPEVIERLTKLWEARLAAAQPDPAAHRAELNAYPWWFVTRRFDPEWALGQLSAVLRLIGNLEHPFDVPKYLAELTPQYPRQTVECLSLMVDGSMEGWQIQMWCAEARAILAAAKQSGDLGVLEAVDDVVNRLGARGYFEFRDLLA